MDAAGDQQAVDPCPSRAGNVGAQTVADGEDVRAIGDAEKAEAGIVDRMERLAVPANMTSRLLIPLGQCAGAQVKSAAAHDNEIGVGTNHRQTAAERVAQQWLVILDLVVPPRRPCIEDELGFLGGIDIFKIQSLPDLQVALGADMQASPAERGIKRIVAPFEALPSFLTRRHNVMVQPGWNTDRSDAPDDVVGPSRRIGQQDDSLASIDQRVQAVDGSRDRGDPVMDHAPKIENEAVVARRQLPQAADQLNRHVDDNSKITNTVRSCRDIEH